MVNFKRIVLEALIIFCVNSFLLESTRSETFISGVFRLSLRRIASIGPEHHQPVEIQFAQRPGPHYLVLNSTVYYFESKFDRPKIMFSKYNLTPKMNLR